MPEQAPTPGNVFSNVAYLLFHVRHSLEEPGVMGGAPRWIRIARARGDTGTGPISDVVKKAIDGFAEALSYMVDLTLDIREVLVQTDAAKALGEVMVDFVAAATSPDFINGVNQVLNLPTGGAVPAPLAAVGEALPAVEKVLGYIPDPDDVNVLGHELYRLLCIEQKPLPRKADGTVDETKLKTEENHIDLERSGKIRLLQWAFNQKLTVFGLGPKSNPEELQQDITRYGARWLWSTSNDKLPPAVLERWNATGGNLEVIVEWFYDGRESDEARRTIDIKETFLLLDKLGYPVPPEAQRTSFGNELTQSLRRFQAINALPVSGELDNPTLNRLLHLDYSAKNILRARPFAESDLPEGFSTLAGGYLRVVNPGAEDYIDEGSSLVAHARYPYYKVGKPLPVVGPAPVESDGGWISDEGGDAIPGFVALCSRPLESVEGSEPKRMQFAGGRWSEGEAASGGRFFFAARHTEPWKPGRRDAPTESIFPPSPDWVNGQPPPGAVSRIYQWLPLDKISRPAGLNMYLTATVLRRSLYEERTGTAGHVPDRGTIALEFYGTDVFKGLGTPRPRNRSNEPAELRDATRRADPWPPSAASAALLSDEEVFRKRNWVPQKLENVRVPASAVAVLLILEGIHTAGWDTDAYFDDVMVTYSFRR